MNEPSLFNFTDGQLVPQGVANIEMQTPEEFISSSPLQRKAEHRWGKYVVHLLVLEEKVDTGETAVAYYAIAERAREDGRGMDPKWALIQFREEDLDLFCTKFKSYCERTS